MYLRILPEHVEGSLLPGRWRIALVRDIGPGPGLQLERASFAPLDQVHCFFSRGGIPSISQPVRVESIHQEHGIGVGFNFYLEKEAGFITVEMVFNPADPSDTV